MAEEDWFAREMEKVRPLNAEKSRAQASSKSSTTKKHQLLRQLEHKETVQTHLQHKRGASPQRADNWLLRADGISGKEIKSLAQADISHELDLHGLTQDEAIEQMQQFVSSAIARNIRKLSIVHGRGNHSTGKSILKETTYHWLQHGPLSHMILAATPSAQSKGGACHVLLRKQNP